MIYCGGIKFARSSSGLGAIFEGEAPLAVSIRSEGFKVAVPQFGLGDK